jgi:molybdopterin converting factor small subunit
VVTLRYWAAARQAAGVAEETYAGVASLAELLAAAGAAHPDDGRLALVLRRCSYLVDEQPVGTRAHETVALTDGAVVEALPPFAGG